MHIFHARPCRSAGAVVASKIIFCLYQQDMLGSPVEYAMFTEDVVY